jgi:hypothetical protein
MLSRFLGKSPSFLVNPTELEIFWQDFVGKALVTVNPTELVIFWQDFCRKALVLVNLDALNERLSTVSSPYMVLCIKVDTRSGMPSQYLADSLTLFQPEHSDSNGPIVSNKSDLSIFDFQIFYWFK